MITHLSRSSNLRSFLCPDFSRPLVTWSVDSGYEDDNPLPPIQCCSLTQILLCPYHPTDRGRSGCKMQVKTRGGGNGIGLKNWYVISVDDSFHLNSQKLGFLTFLFFSLFFSGVSDIKYCIVLRGMWSHTE